MKNHVSYSNTNSDVDWIISFVKHALVSRSPADDYSFISHYELAVSF